ncbi:MAG: Pycsar system effector family protein, partial [Anaerolineales bacterium]
LAGWARPMQLFRSLTIVLAIAYVGGVLLSVYAAFMIILPRLRGSRQESVVYFGDVAKHELGSFVTKYNKLTK